MMVNVDEGLVHVKKEETCHSYKEEEAFKRKISQGIGPNGTYHSFSKGQDHQQLITLHKMWEVEDRIKVTRVPVSDKGQAEEDWYKNR